MITTEEEKYILERAYIPEHIVGLMTSVSGGEPYLFQNYFCCRKEDWVILVGYPLEKDFTIKDLAAVIDETKRRFRPRYLSLIAPELPPSLSASCEEKETDNYYTLSVPMGPIKSGIRRLIRKAQENATVERSREMGEAHKALTEEFIERAKYVIGCHSKKNYVQGASDFLCHEMVEMSVEYGKKYVHLGLGVNEGI
jgi:hypothetical protein